MGVPFFYELTPFIPDFQGQIYKFIGKLLSFLYNRFNIRLEMMNNGSPFGKQKTCEALRNTQSASTKQSRLDGGLFSRLLIKCFSCIDRRFPASAFRNAFRAGRAQLISS
ncbi:MAG: hypothetical protein EA344_08785 [Alkalicoccus sp.]|nr:MAG: hypothetical protein EA344_08785 [Alkalicoccus sp.]